MKKTVRVGTFETNSSSTHSLTICSQEDYTKFVNGELFITWDNKFRTKEEIIKELVEYDSVKFSEESLREMSKSEFAETVKYYDYADYGIYGRDFEWFEKSYTTPKGETLVAFGYYGYDG